MTRCQRVPPCVLQNATVGSGHTSPPGTGRSTGNPNRPRADLSTPPGPGNPARTRQPSADLATPRTSVSPARGARRQHRSRGREPPSGAGAPRGATARPACGTADRGCGRHRPAQHPVRRHRAGSRRRSRRRSGSGSRCDPVDHGSRRRTSGRRSRPPRAPHPRAPRRRLRRREGRRGRALGARIGGARCLG